MISKVRAFLVNSLDRGMGNLGYERISICPPVDFRGILADPAIAIKRAVRRPVILDIPMQYCRGFEMLSFRFTEGTSHPFVLAAEDYQKNGKGDYRNSVLEEYFHTVQPDSAGDLFGVDSCKTDQFCRLEPMEAELPWRGIPGAHVKKRRAHYMVKEAEDHGFTLSASDGWHHVGPVHPRKGELEMDRICKLMRSILQNGYMGGRGSALTGEVLYRGGSSYVVLVRHGNHRAAVLFALGYKNLPVIVRHDAVVYRDDVHDWPGVRRGAFTKSQALDLFDRIFEGAQPKFMKEVWPNRKTSITPNAIVTGKKA